jgi:hypothetical protein
MEKRQRTRLASAGVLAVVFASGTLIGMAVQRSMGSETVVAGVPAPPDTVARSANGAGAAADGQSRTTQRPRIYHQVLAPEQIVVADSLVQVIEARRDVIERDFRRDMDSIFVASARPQQYRQEREALTTELRAAVRGLMTPDQLTVYDSLLAVDDARRRAEREAREQGRGGSGRQGRSGSPPN